MKTEPFLISNVIKYQLNKYGTGEEKLSARQKEIYEEIKKRFDHSVIEYLEVLMFTQLATFENGLFANGILPENMSGEEFKKMILEITSNMAEETAKIIIKNKRSNIVLSNLERYAIHY